MGAAWNKCHTWVGHTDSYIFLIEVNPKIWIIYSLLLVVKQKAEGAVIEEFKNLPEIIGNKWQIFLESVYN